MARKAQSYPCPFCTYTGETRKTAQAHLIAKHLTRLAAKYLRTKMGGAVPPAMVATGYSAERSVRRT